MLAISSLDGRTLPFASPSTRAAIAAGTLCCVPPVGVTVIAVLGDDLPVTDAGGHLLVGRRKVDRRRVGPVLDVPDDAGDDLCRVLVAAVVDRHHLDGRPHLANVAGDLGDRGAEPVELEAGPARALTQLPDLGFPLAAGLEEFKILVGTLAVLPVRLIGTRPPLHGGGVDLGEVATLRIWRGLRWLAQPAEQGIGEATHRVRHPSSRRGAGRSRRRS